MQSTQQTKRNFTSLEEASKRIKELEEDLSVYKYSEIALKESELRFELLAEIAPVGIFRTDSKGLTNYVNPYWCRISGISAREAMKNGWLKAVHPEDREKLSDIWKQTTEYKEQSTAQYRFLHENGSIAWVIGKAIPVRDNVGNISGYIGTITDITRLKNAEENLNKKLKFEIILSKISSMFINVNHKNIDKSINAALEMIGNYVGTDRSYVFMTSDDGTVLNNTHEWCRKGIPSEIENLQNIGINEYSWWINKLKMSHIIQVDNVSQMPDSAKKERLMLEEQGIKSLLALPMDTDNSLFGFLGFDSVKKAKTWKNEETVMLKVLAEIFVNAFKRVNAEKQIRRSEERNRAIVSLLPDMFFRLNKQGVFLDCSNHNHEEFYLPLKEFLGKKITDVLPETIANMAMTNIENAFSSGEIQIFHYPLSIKQEEFWYEARMIPAGQEEVLIIVRDITASRKQQRILEQKNEELEKYAYTVSHDLKSPLVTIKGFSLLLLEDIKQLQDTKMQTDIKRIINATNKMAKMLEELLEISRAGKITNTPQKVHLAVLVSEVLDLLAIPISESNANVIVHKNLPVVNTDKNRVKEVLQNLIENALKFSTNVTKPIIEIGVKKIENKRVIFVKDNGIGIAPEYHDKIFGLFSKLNPNIKGSGIGLPLSKRIIESLNGEIWVESEGKNKGATFCFIVSGK
ncbi:MAG: PAS domain-containing sensor histidine kinase [Bacteroidota bacterium]